MVDEKWFGDDYLIMRGPFSIRNNELSPDPVYEDAVILMLVSTPSAIVCNPKLRAI